MKKRIVCVILIILVLQFFLNLVFAESSVINEITNSITTDNDETEKLEAEKQEVEDKIDETNIKLEYVQDELSATMMRVQEIEDRVIRYEKEISELGNQMQILQTSINDATQKLEIASQNYDEKKQILLNKLVIMYELGDTVYLDVLLNSKNIIDFISRYYVIEEMAEYDRFLIKQVEHEKENIETTKQKLEKEQSEIKILKARNEQTSIVLSNTKTLQQSYIKKLSEGEKILQEQISVYKKEQSEIEAKILAATNNIQGEIQYTGGEMLWPVAINGTVITSYFGIREHLIQGVIKQHTGLDI